MFEIQKLKINQGMGGREMGEGRNLKRGVCPQITQMGMMGGRFEVEEIKQETYSLLGKFFDSWAIAL